MVFLDNCLLNRSMAHYDVVLVRLIQYIQRRLSPPFSNSVSFATLYCTVASRLVFANCVCCVVWWPSGKYKLCAHHHTNKMQPANFLDLSSRVIVVLIARHVRWRIWMRLNEETSLLACKTTIASTFPTTNCIWCFARKRFITFHKLANDYCDRHTRRRLRLNTLDRKTLNRTEWIRINADTRNKRYLYTD